MLLWLLFGFMNYLMNLDGGAGTLCSYYDILSVCSLDLTLFMLELTILTLT